MKSLPSQAIASQTDAGPWRSYGEMVQLVAIDGRPLHDSEKATETCPTDHLPAHSWPAWTDLVTVKLLGRDFEHHVGGAKLADAYRQVMEREDGEPDMPPEPDLGGEWDDTGEYPPIILPEPDAPDAGAPSRPWMLNPPRISGGAPEEQPYDLPTAADLAEYDDWSRALDLTGDFPRPKDRHDVAEDMAEIREWFARNA